MCSTEISDETWQRLEPVLLLEGSPKGGRPAKDKRTFINAISWLLRTGAPWRALPEEYGAWNAVYSRFRRWQMKGFWKAVFLTLASDRDLERVMIDGTAGAKGDSTDKLWAAVPEVLPPSCIHR